MEKATIEIKITEPAYSEITTIKYSTDDIEIFNEIVDKIIQIINKVK